MNNIGQLMQASAILQQGINNPVARLRTIVDDMRNKLKYYNGKHPETDTSKRWQLLQELELICQTLEKCEPISLMPIINKQLQDAYRDDFHPDVAVIILPLKSYVQDLLHCRPAYIDLVGFGVDNPREFDYLGMLNGQYICEGEEVNS